MDKVKNITIHGVNFDLTNVLKMNKTNFFKAYKFHNKAEEIWEEIQKLKPKSKSKKKKTIDTKD